MSEWGQGSCETEVTLAFWLEERGRLLESCTWLSVCRPCLALQSGLPPLGTFSATSHFPRELHLPAGLAGSFAKSAVERAWSPD